MGWKRKAGIAARDRLPEVRSGTPAACTLRLNPGARDPARNHGTNAMADGDAPYHAHIYYSAGQRAAAAALRDAFVLPAKAGDEPPVLFVGRMMDEGVGPHPLPQYEVHFLERSLAEILAAIHASGLRALVHPLTDDDMADHTSLAHWVGAPVDLDVTVLDPPGHNQGMKRFGKTDF